MNKLMWLVFVVSTGCAPAASQQQPGYFAQGQPAPQQPAARGPSGCTQLLACFTDCGQDGACIQGCLQQSDPTSQAQVQAMMQCNSTRCENEGGDCLQSQCGAEIQACSGPVQVAQAAPQEPQQYDEPAPAATTEVMRPGQPHTTANLLPWLQQGNGQWIGTNHQFTFFPDGRVLRASGVAMYTDRGTYGCVSVINEEGTIRQEGDQLIMDFETQDQNHCRHREKGPALTVRYQITWYQYSDMPVNLLLVDLTCAPGQSMYCDNQMRKR